MNGKPTVSIVVPLRNERSALLELYRRVKTVMEGTAEDWELVLVDDGSQDQTAEAIAFLCAQDCCARGIRLTRHFGSQIAVTAGIDAARGCAVILMSPGLQDPPETIPDLVTGWRAGYDVVFGARDISESQGRLQRAAAGGLYRLVRRVIRAEVPLDATEGLLGDLRLMDRRVVDAFKRMPERHRSLGGMVAWIGFKQIRVACTGRPNGSSRSTFSFRRMLGLALDAVTGYSRLPLQLAVWFGFAAVLLSMLAAAGAFGMGLLDGAIHPGANTQYTKCLTDVPSEMQGADYVFAAGRPALHPGGSWARTTVTLYDCGGA